MEPRPNFAFFENTLPRELWNKVGRKLGESFDLASSRGGVRGSGCSFPPSWPKAPLESRNFVPKARNLLHLCSKAPQATCSSKPHGVFIKSRGSISVAHTGPGPNPMRYFACVVRVLTSPSASHSEICFCWCPYIPSEPTIRYQISAKKQNQSASGTVQQRAVWRFHKKSGFHFGRSYGSGA